MCFNKLPPTSGCQSHNHPAYSAFGFCPSHHWQCPPIGASFLGRRPGQWRSHVPQWVQSESGTNAGAIAGLITFPWQRRGQFCPSFRLLLGGGELILQRLPGGEGHRLGFRHRSRPGADWGYRWFSPQIPGILSAGSRLHSLRLLACSVVSICSKVTRMVSLSPPTATNRKAFSPPGVPAVWRSASLGSGRRIPPHNCTPGRGTRW